MSIHQEQDAEVVSVSTSIQQLEKLSGKAYYDQWLAMQCSLVVGAEFGVLLMKTPESEGFSPVSVWPDSAIDMDSLKELVEEVIDQHCGLITTLENKGKKTIYGLAYPVIIDEQVFAIIALRVCLDDQKILKYTMQLLEWGCAWIELSERRHKNELSESRNREISKSINLLAYVLSEETGDAAALRLVTEIADVFDADRVTIGFIKHKRIRLEQVSHSISFGKRMNIIQCLEAVMNEAVDQHRIFRFPPADNSASDILVAHEKLYQITGQCHILTVPLYVNDEIVGAIILERAHDRPFRDDEADYCDSVCAIAVSAVIEKKKNNKNIFLKIIESLHDSVSSVIGPGHLALKFALLAIIAVIIFFSMATKTYNLSADARLQGEITRAIVAPFDGYIDAAMVRAGDRLEQGDTIVSLDIRDYYLEKLRWSSEIEKLQRQRQEAMAGSERAAVNVLTAQLQQAQIQLDMVEIQIERANIRAPFHGLLVSGDLSQRLGGAVEKGELLFEISPLDRYRVNLQVRENRIADIELGQEGRLYLSALPDRPFDFTVSRISPVNISDNGQTYFIVEANLHGADPELQVGMEGVGQIRIDERKIISIWTRDLIDWLRLQLWSLPI